MPKTSARAIYRNPTLYTAGIGYLLVQAALTPLALVLPSLARAYGLEVGEAGWVQSAFLLTLTALMLPSGRLGDLLGHRCIFAYGMVVLGLATAAIPWSPSFGWLVALRAVQGVGGAMVTGTSLAVIAHEFPAAHHGRTMGIVTMMSALGAVVSLVVTGALMDRLGWQAAFYFAIPLAALGVAGVIPMWRSRPSAARVSVDLPGLILLALTILGLYLTVNPISAVGLSDLFQPAMGAFTLVTLGGLLWWERRAANPVFEVRHLWRGGFGLSLGAHCAYHMSMMVMIFSIPFFVERALAFPASHAAVILLPMQAITTVMAGVGGWLHDRTRSPWLPSGSLFGICLGLGILGLSAREISYAGLVVVVTFLGAAGGVFMATNNTTVMSSLGPGLHGFASGMLETVRQLGHGLSIPILTASLASGGAAAAAAGGTSFTAGFRSAMLVMASIVLGGALLAASRRPAAAGSETPILLPEGT